MTFRLISAAMAALFALLAAAPAEAQPLVITDAPKPLQLYPRNPWNRALVPVAGRVQAAGHDSLTLVLRRDGDLVWAQTQLLEYGLDGAPFAFSPEIEAGRVNYSFHLRLDAMLIASVDSVVCGDVILLNGQSNTVAPGETEFQSTWIRSFGSTAPDSAACAADTSWGVAEDNDWSTNHAVIGVWGMVLAHQLSEYLDLPIAVLNGAVGGTIIEQHQRNDSDPFDLTTIYGRLLYRAERSGLREHARALFWHQGESDGVQQTGNGYPHRWDALHRDWCEDYPALETVYQFQLRPALAGAHQDIIREFQRTLPRQDSRVRVMSTTGIDGFDGLHYNAAGYEAMGNLVWPLAARDLYGRPMHPLREAPDLLRAWYPSPDRDRVATLWTQPVIWPADTLHEALVDYFYLDDEWGMVHPGMAHPDDPRRLDLPLDGPSPATLLNYGPVNQWHDGDIYQGPWLRNTLGVGALMQQDFPIDPAIGVRAVWLNDPHVLPGDTLALQVTLTNHSSEPGTRAVWSEAVSPGGVVIPVMAPQVLELPADSDLQLHRLQPVPANAPPGRYAYRVHVG